MKYTQQTILLLILFSQVSFAQKLTPHAIHTHAEQKGETTWQKVTQNAHNLTSREIYRYALVLCETGNHPERLAPLFQAGAQMQDRDPNSRGYGNFYWRLSETTVRDFNAVEFCMQSAALIWLRHQHTLPPNAKSILQETLTHAIQGCMKHGVRESYTNIALMNAHNLILLGEATNQTSIANEGQRRLKLAAQYTYRFGTHEYVSPTYYGVNLEVLTTLAHFAQNPKSRDLAHALLTLMWTDTALNFYPPNQKLAGTHSRSYDYLRGLGHLDVNLRIENWISGGPRGGTDAIYATLTPYHPSAEIIALSSQYPRLIRQSWDIPQYAARTHYILPDITLSTSGANYRAQDIMLAINFPGPRTSVNGYFIPDARHDPYGKKRIAAGNHQKALHLTPLWRATQRTHDALGLVSYRTQDLPKSYTTLESHIVLPRKNDGLYHNNTPINLTSAITLTTNDALILKMGTAAVGIRIPNATKQDGTPATIQIVDDQNTYDAIRLTVNHFSTQKKHEPNAAFWVRVGSSLHSETEFQTWQQQFTAAKPLVTNPNLTITVPATDGALKLDLSGDIVEPAHTTAVLEYNGQDIGRPLFDQIDWFAQTLKQNTPDTINIALQGTYWEAESGRITAPIITDQDLKASQEQYVWMSAPKGARGGSDLGAVTFRINLPTTNTYYIWARVLTPTPDDDSFYLRLYTTKKIHIPRSSWHMGQHKTWTWIPIKLEDASTITPFSLPQGLINLELRVREDGAKIDKLYITSNIQNTPSN